MRVNLDVQDSQRDSLRLKACLPTLRFLLTAGARPIIISHRGRPQGIDASLSLAPAIAVLEKELGEKLSWHENVRFDSRESENSIAFAKELAANADIYVNDDFATSHRTATSLVAITKLLPSYAGLHLEEEVTNLSRVRDNYDIPRVVIIGGIKLEDKLGVIQKLENENTRFLLGSAYRLPREALPANANILLPQDGIGGDPWLDIGPQTTQEYTKIIATAKTIIWSGPLGNAENEAYAAGSRAIAQAIIKSGAFSVAGGGDTADFLQKEGLLTKFNWVSTGGSAMLAFLASKPMPALQPLMPLEDLEDIGK